MTCHIHAYLRQIVNFIGIFQFNTWKDAGNRGFRIIKYGAIIITEVTDVIDITIYLTTQSKRVIAVGINSVLFKWYIGFVEYNNRFMIDNSYRKTYYRRYKNLLRYTITSYTPMSVLPNTAENRTLLFHFKFRLTSISLSLYYTRLLLTVYNIRLLLHTEGTGMYPILCLLNKEIGWIRSGPLPPHNHVFRLKFRSLRLITYSQQ